MEYLIFYELFLLPVSVDEFHTILHQVPNLLLEEGYSLLLHCNPESRKEKAAKEAAEKAAAEKAAKEAAKRAKQLAQKTAQVAKAAAKATAKIAVKIAQVVAQAVAKLVSALVAAGGWAVLIVVLIVIIIIAALAASPFGIFISEEVTEVGTIPLSQIIAECNVELTQEVENIELSVAHDDVDVIDNQANWNEIIAVRI
mgnify:CR=1 FL=1